MPTSITIAFVVVGLIALMAAIAGSVKGFGFDYSVNTPTNRIVAAIFGIICLVVAALVQVLSQPPSPVSQITSAANGHTGSQASQRRIQTQPSTTVAPPAATKPAYDAKITLTFEGEAEMSSDGKIQNTTMTPDERNKGGPWPTTKVALSDQAPRFFKSAYVICQGEGGLGCNYVGKQWVKYYDKDPAQPGAKQIDPTDDKEAVNIHYIEGGLVNWNEPAQVVLSAEEWERVPASACPKPQTQMVTIGRSFVLRVPGKCDSIGLINWTRMPSGSEGFLNLDGPTWRSDAPITINSRINSGETVIYTMTLKP